ncbi:MAG: hypothetical protein PHQ72_06090 [Hespellia sp.]|nr:hypothetical protein [Hespellia sp.]
MQIKNFMSSNPIVKGIILCAAFVFPILCVLYVGSGKPNAFNFVWIAFYSSVLFCVVFQSKVAKAIICCMNGISVIGLTLFFLMGGTQIIGGVIWNAIVPFLPNPWY